MPPLLRVGQPAARCAISGIRSCSDCLFLTDYVHCARIDSTPATIKVKNHDRNEEVLLSEQLKTTTKVAPLLAIGFALLLAPPLLLTLPFVEVVVIVATLVLSLLLLSARSSTPEQLAFLGAAAAAILVLSMLGADEWHAKPWVFGIPAGLMFLRPWLALALAGTILLIASLVQVPLGNAIQWLIIAACTAGPAFWAVRLLFAGLVSPIGPNLVILVRLILVFLVYFGISTVWFALLFLGLSTNYPASFITSAGTIPTAADFIVFSGMLNVSGEVVYVSPVSRVARFAALSEMVTSFVFTGIYFAVALSNFMQARSRRGHGLGEGGDHEVH